MKRRTKFEIFGLVVLGVVVAGTVFKSVSEVKALSYQSNVGVGFTFEPTLNVTLSNSDLVINNLSPNTGSDSNVITVNVATNAAYGYDLFSTVGNTANVTTELKNGGNSFASLSSNVATLASFDDNKWGYSYSTDFGSSWVSGDYGSTSAGYAGLPLYTGTGVKLASADDNTDSTVQFKIAAKASTAQASGEYTNVVNFAAVANAIPATLYDAFAASGAVMVNGYYKMQDMTSSICNAAEGTSWLQLLDTRDNKLYWVAKLADGHCWMTQNLDLDLSPSTTLTSNDTDLNDNSMAGAYGKDYAYDATNNIISWTPQNTTKHSATGDGTNWANSYNVAYSIDPGEWYWDGDDTGTTACNYLTAVCDHFSRTPYNTTMTHGHVGNYYNWSAAIASDDSSTLTAGTYNNVINNPQNSICPKGWRLPTISNRGNVMNSTSEFAGVNGLYNDGITNNDKKLIASPLWFVRSGFVYGGSLYNPGSEAYYWSSTVGSSYFAYVLSFTVTGVDPANYGDRDYGRSVRCVAR